MSQCVHKPYERSGGNVKLELDLSNYATKADLKEEICANTSNLAVKLDLTNLKAVVRKIDIDELKAVPAGISNLSNVVDNNVVKKICMIN